MNDIKIGKGKNPLEQKAIDAKLDQLEVTIDPSTRTVNEAGAAGSKVRGGLQGLKNAASATGSPNVLDLADLTALEEKVGLSTIGKAAKWLVGKGDGNLARARIASAAMSNAGAADALNALMAKLGEGGTVTGEAFNGVFRRLEKAGSDLKEALADEALAHARPKELMDLRQSYLSLLGALAEHGARFEFAVNKVLLPKMRAMADYHNGLTLGQRITQGVNVPELEELSDRISRMTGVVSGILDQSAMFQPHPGIDGAAAAAPVQETRAPDALTQRADLVALKVGNKVKENSRAGRFFENDAYSCGMHQFHVLHAFALVAAKLELGKAGNSYGNVYAHGPAQAKTLETEGVPTDLVVAAINESKELYLAAMKLGPLPAEDAKEVLRQRLPADKKDFADLVSWMHGRASSEQLSRMAELNR